ARRRRRPPAPRRPVHRVGGAAHPPATHALGPAPPARAGAGGVGAQGHGRPPRPASLPARSRSVRGERDARPGEPRRAPRAVPVVGRLLVLARPDHRRGHRGGAAQHHRRARPRTPPGSGLIAFLHGVASGDPSPGSVVLWTRLSGAGDTAVAVEWKVATDPELRSVVAAGSAVASPE